MAEKQWQPIKIRYCKHAGCEVALEAETIYPVEFLSDQPPRIAGHRCAHWLECNKMDQAACVWAGSNPGYDPFEEKD